MFDFDIFTDSSCDLPKNIIEQFDLKVMQLEVIMGNNPPVLNNQLDLKYFYDQLRTGVNVKTSAVTPGYFEEHMRESLVNGKDILYLGFSSGLSATYQNGVMVMEELQQEFPERTLYHVDTKAASMGQGLLVYYAALLRESGTAMKKIRDVIEEMKNRIHHCITVEELKYLKRGGRIDAKTALIGSVLQFKPIINVNLKGRLENAGKVRGRKASLKELFTRMKEAIDIDGLSYIFLSHSDCIEDAKTLVDMLKNEFVSAQIAIGEIGPVIGAHTGPGALILSYLGKTEKGVQ